MTTSSRDQGKRCLTMEEGLERRALAAYFRSGGSEQPAAALTGVFVTEYEAAPDLIGFRSYVRLANENGTLAVYRHANWGELRRLKRWPASVDDGTAQTYQDFSEWFRTEIAGDVSETVPKDIDTQDLEATLAELSAAT